MIAAGSVEAFAATYLNQGMRHSPHRFVRRCVPFVPLLSTGIDLIQGARNLSVKNNYYCVNRGYLFVDGGHWVAPLVRAAGHRLALASLRQTRVMNFASRSEVTTCGSPESNHYVHA